ncbi:hypothetical protein CHUAL_007028 [Chamberlinius hualienensis]
MQKLFVSMLVLATIIQVFSIETPTEASDGDNLVSIIQRFLKKREDVLPNADDRNYAKDALRSLDEDGQMDKTISRRLLKSSLVLSNGLKKGLIGNPVVDVLGDTKNILTLAANLTL